MKEIVVTINQKWKNKPRRRRYHHGLSARIVQIYDVKCNNNRLENNNLLRIGFKVVEKDCLSYVSCSVSFHLGGTNFKNLHQHRSPPYNSDGELIRNYCSVVKVKVAGVEI